MGVQRESSDMAEFPFTQNVEIQYPSAEVAQIVCNTLSVDQEIRPERSVRELRTDGNKLIANFRATEMRFLRVAVCSFYEVLLLSTQTVAEFQI
eukprot:TRINITY_DN2840_c0_g1_i3.p1 TRINITY_DN2840_c0_g1~~TRINITY_DN2840_c0_g1_i3.p1  ORF type:complete len:104 (-),score=16.27 TRINITY_DN2840_c0_g1_i3:31-312(-)